MASESHAPARELLDGTLLLADILRQAGLNYALIGGLAAGFRTQTRFTRDADFILQIPQLKLPGVLADLQAQGFEFELESAIRDWNQRHMTVLSYRAMRIDWLKPVLPIYQHVLDRAKDEVWLGHTIRVATVEGLILTKLLANRAQDQLDITNLVAVHRDNLDLDWIRSEWQTVAPLDDPRMRGLIDLIGKGR